MGPDPGMKPSHLTAILLLLFTALTAGCATAPKETDSSAFSNKTTESSANNKEIESADEDPCLQGDPYEKFNRRFYDVTESIDQSIFEPVADSYIDNIPSSVRSSVGNFYSNLAYPNVVLNVLLQGKIKQGMGDGLRFLINSTVGLAGIFDPATSLGLSEHNEDFGQTLGVWGVDNKSYVYLPILGPSSSRDVIGLPVTMASNMLFYAGFIFGAPVTIPLGLLAAIDKRAQYTEEIRIRNQAALDSYIFTREAYWQYRENLVFDGKPPIEAYDSLFIDEDLSDTSDTSYFKEPCPEES
jgi:phospholipid-binding lipoprotein MlaA